MTRPYFPRVMTKCVIDVSHFDGLTIDWHEVRRKNPWIVGVICKCSQGSSFIDPSWAYNLMGVPDAGLRLAAYHYVTSDDVHAQVDNILARTKGIASRLRIDVEGKNLAIPDVERLAVSLANKMGRLPDIYIGRYGPDGNDTGLPNTMLGRCKLWLPEYGTHPVCPPGWDKWEMWQFTESATIPGIGPNVDVSYYAGTAAACASLWDT